jgi:UDP-N-acetylglucosamine 2-epimerase (non-hydrolysing)
MKIALVAGARPNFMKVAPIIRALSKENAQCAGFEFELIHTGQHYDDRLSSIFFEQLGLPKPTANLGAGSGTQAEQTGRIMIEFERYLSANPCDIVMVVGDVNSTMACAIVAKKNNTRVAHVEAGIRSFDLAMPEEINRMVTDSITDYFFTTSEVANQNLIKTGIDASRIFFVGNTMIDTLLHSIPLAKKPTLWDSAALQEHMYMVLTLHRPSNVDDPRILKDWLQVVDSLGLPVVFPVHPRTRKAFGPMQLEFKNIVACEPLSYLEFIFLLKSAKAVITDSGGVQEETTVLGVPCITLRTTTERPETVTMGTNVLMGSDPERLKKSIPSSLALKQSVVPPLWDGRAAERIVDVLVQISKLGANA